MERERMGSSRQMLTKLPEVPVTSLPPPDLPKTLAPQTLPCARSSARSLEDWDGFSAESPSCPPVSPRLQGGRGGEKRGHPVSQ